MGRSIVARAGLKPSDITLEIGPGTGNLTVRLLEQSKKVIAVEFDRRMVREVLKRVEGRCVRAYVLRPLYVLNNSTVCLQR